MSKCIKNRRAKRLKKAKNVIKHSKKRPRNELLHRIRQTIDHFTPDLREVIADIEDYRGNRAVYAMEEIILAAVFMYLIKAGSRNRMNEDRDEEQFRRNYKALFGLRLPHLDTVSDVMKQLDSQFLEEIRKHIISYLLDKRTLHRFRLLGQYFMEAIDGSGVYTFEKEPYPGCPHKTSKTGKKTYYQNVLEAKIVCSNGFSYP